MSKKPLYDNVIVKPIKPTLSSSGGIILVNKVLDNVSRGIVVEVGDGTLLASGKIHPLSVKIGDEVMYGLGTGLKMKMDDVEVVLLRESQIFGIMEK